MTRSEQHPCAVVCGHKQMRHELELVLMTAKELPIDELPHLLGELEEIRATALARLTAPASVQAQQHDELLDTGEAAHRLGISKDFLYRNHRGFSFTRRVGRRLLFSSLGIERYIRQQERIDSKAAGRYLQHVATGDRRLKV
jgi:predicted DNA-binding transcriptional regulator AlpA